MPKRRQEPDSDVEEQHAASPKRARTAGDSDSEVEAHPSRSNGQNGDAKKRVEDHDDDLEIEMLASDIDDEAKAEEFERTHSAQIRNLVNAHFAKKSHSGTVAEHGIIESVEMHNFMCHKYLQMQFGPQINFIIGHNGSGKSAVLSAITVALGGKSTSTGRGTGLKSFIREGSQWSEVSVTLKNQGEDAFKPSEYGKSITVTRRFTKEGSTSWKISRAGANKKDAKVISHKKEELSALCDHMNIQVDNPMSVLTQDAARQFLSASTPADKYKFFLKGTQLQQLHDEYGVCLDNIQATQKILSQKKDTIPELRRQLEEATRRYEEAQKARQQKLKIEDLKKEKAWAHVQDKQREMEKKMKEKASAEKRVPDVQVKVTENQENLTNIEARIQESHTALNNLDDTTALENEKSTVQAKIKANMLLIHDLQADMKEIGNNKAKADSQIRAYDQEIAQARALLAQNTDAKRLERQAALDAAQTAVAEAQATLDENMKAQQEAGQEQDRLRRLLDEANSRMQELQRKVAACQNDIDQARRSENDKYAGYGHNMKQLLQEIQSSRWYGEIPLGPLGIHVRAREYNWGDFLRKQLTPLLTSFAVTDPRDRRQLKDILSRYNNGHCNIIISKRDMFDYTHGEPPAQFLTILRALEFDNEAVLRIFINQRRIEKTILARTRREAESSMRGALRGNFEALTLDGFTVRIYAGGGGQSAPLSDGNKNASPNFLRGHESQAAMIHRYESIKHAAEEEGKQANHALEDLKKQFFAQKDKGNALQRAGKGLHTTLQSAKRRLGRAQEEANEELPADIAALEQVKQDAKAEVESFVAQFEDAARQKAPLDEENKRLIAQRDSVRQRLATGGTARQRLEDEIESQFAKRLTVQSDIRYWQEKVAKEQAKVDDINAMVDVLMEEFTAWRQQALEFTNGEEVPNPRSIAVIEKQIDSTQKALQEQQANQRASLEELASALAKADTKYQLAFRDYKQMTELNKVLRHALTKRLHKWQEFRLHIALRCKHTFTYHLSHRGYFGKVLFTHSKGTLELKVQTDEQRAKSQGQREKDPKSLSGGEKSFSTICLLLSLWDSIGCPLRCLDEFDVFMDAVNRRISMKMMIDTANSSSTKQYILITPLDMSHVPRGPTVRIQRMADPERGQGTLVFGSQ